MLIIRAEEFGGPDVLQPHEADVPEPGPGQILVRVESAAVNFADVLRRRNEPYPFPTPLPFTPGSEVAGTVEALGPGVGGPSVGTPVLALVGQDGSTGYAQYAVAGAAQVIPTPHGVHPDHAAGLIVAGSTAMLALTDVSRLQAGEALLVEGAGGGVGQYAVQLGKLLGATVVGAGSTDARRRAAVSAGADGAVDPTRAGWSDEARRLTGGSGFDVVLHVGGQATFAESLAALAPFGRLVVLGKAMGRPLRLEPDQVDALFYAPALNQSLLAFNLGLYFGLRPERAVAALQRLLGDVAGGRLTAPVGRVLPLTRAAEAHRLLEERASTGKIVLKPWVR